MECIDEDASVLSGTFSVHYKTERFNALNNFGENKILLRPKINAFFETNF